MIPAPSLRRLGAMLSILTVAALCWGCAGYRLGSVGGKNIQGVTSVYVPVIKNQTLEPSIDVLTTAAIVRRFDQDGTLKTEQSENADSQLDVTLVEANRDILVTEKLDSQAGNQFQIVLVARVTYLNRKTGKKVLDNVEVKGSNSYIVQRDQVEAERQALPVAEQDLAQHIVALIVEGW